MLMSCFLPSLIICYLYDTVNFCSILFVFSELMLFRQCDIIIIICHVVCLPPRHFNPTQTHLAGGFTCGPVGPKAGTIHLILFGRPFNQLWNTVPCVRRCRFTSGATICLLDVIWFRLSFPFKAWQSHLSWFRGAPIDTEVDVEFLQPKYHSLLTLYCAAVSFRMICRFAQTIALCQPSSPLVGRRSSG